MPAVSRRWPRWLYSAALYLLSPLLWRRVWREQALTNLRRERLGLLPRPPAGVPRLWLHCASVGEVQAARPLIEALLATYPQHHLVVTTMTATGAERVHALIASRRRAGQAERLHHGFVPLDFPGAARRFVARLSPALALFFETEIWPNLLAACQRRGVPTAVVNGRLSPRAYRSYRRVRPLMAAALGRLDWLAAKSRGDAERFRALGMPTTRTDVVGSLKYDLTPDDASCEASKRLCTRFGSRPVWVAGSTHAGEEALLLEAHARLRQSYPDALLILVPRHPQRFEAVAGLVQERGMGLARRSLEEWPDGRTAVYLGDTMGELLMLYGAADLAFVGGSLVPVGGHNLLEPAAMGVPVLTGPELANFADVAETLRQGGALVEVSGSDMLADTLVTLFLDEAERHRLAEAGLAVVAANRGALARTLAGLQRLLPGE
ncbi:3-deoxy-D-manno-octulosonic acid transferase [Halomonas sp. MCCC 1A17488]|uniref:3-deoxy-D-manno-octulosonic acid transferase n=1 Tax=Billgrantia sulfidoxydans TaxID=2733484 RepID=A0ABX7VXK6_9GAMM|nr:MULTISPECIES: lipid IV(A) 3-deoxy-D-manno-octulosonic acid transferase [Halomonas]MCE8017240.1 3-deoxy-D-manno-octulosonic acid transferase [Halomonas sp. MCCC 1A17488]MCG3240573.1 3-deoxy-D-manno-octulosonic acid transferase [Halomonas sp. MCCC 1A17488]QPP49573.1 lipid IV(A) 3-deoxy-D-manno-octulosonic acid transferase [Halomonas sp. SS10-MC5]QTP53209.1 3-deoxy-D-manno-octulosonic acid transferase [Halomonas sulfidoxydans]